jgi:hypothetical protein
MAGCSKYPSFKEIHQSLAHLDLDLVPGFAERLAWTLGQGKYVVGLETLKKITTSLYFERSVRGYR